MTPELCAQMVSAKSWLVIKIGLYNGNMGFYGGGSMSWQQQPGVWRWVATHYKFLFVAKNPIADLPSVFDGCVSDPTGSDLIKGSTSYHMTPQLCLQAVVSANETYSLLPGYNSYALKNWNECWVFTPYTSPYTFTSPSQASTSLFFRLFSRTSSSHNQKKLLLRCKTQAQGTATRCVEVRAQVWPTR
ncbi:hypothetical protein HDU98_010361 [Podochytrium sp. JEL0797]|nr:hypothetical protein HDU98_010361 [Podochytrium sp. JEL0797]